jgi:DNA-binding transcriptional regulator YbjK
MRMDEALAGGRARLTQERSRLRREQLVAAAAKLFAEGGTKAITHRSVSETAQVPLATVSYYFASIDQLIDVMFAESLRRWSDARATLPEGVEATPETVADVFSRSVLDTSAARYAGELQVYLAALSRPELADDVRTMQATIVGAAIELVRSAGAKEPELAASAILMMVTGALVASTSPDVDLQRVGGTLHRQVVRIVQDAVGG